MDSKGAVHRLGYECSMRDGQYDCRRDGCDGCFIKLSMDALRKQNPKKPTHNNVIKEWECPNCHSYFANENDRPMWCCECGQAIDWSEYDRNN